jgi:hypothetical protein
MNTADSRNVWAARIAQSIGALTFGYMGAHAHRRVLLAIELL